MQNAILLHGWAEEDELYDPHYPTASNSHWFPWLSKQLMIKDIHTVAVEMPNAPYPIYEQWKKEFERFEIHEDTILVGHSCGGGFLIRWLSENSDIKVGNLILVAPWMGFDFGVPFDKTFFDFEIDQDLSARTKSLKIISSTNDFPAINDSVQLLLAKLQNITHIQLKNKGHFCIEDMGTEEFPELLEELLK